MVPPTFDPDEFVSVQVTVCGDAVVVEVSGEVDAATRAAMAGPVFASLAEAPPRLVIDLTQIEFISCAGLSVLAEAHARAWRHATALRIVATTRTVLKPLEVTGLRSTLPIYPSVAAALNTKPVVPPPREAQEQEKRRSTVRSGARTGR